MAVKTITIDLEAYDILARGKKPGQSFSQVIKARLGTRRTGRDLWQALSGGLPSEETLDRADQQIKARRRSPARAPKL